MTNEYKDRKIVCVVSDALETWQAMNVVGHLAIGLGANKDDVLMGRSVLIDASGGDHKGIARYGLIIKTGSVADIRKLVVSCRTSTAVVSLDFPREMLETADDDELANALLKKDEADLEYLGVILYGPTSDVHLFTKKFPLLS